MTVAIQSEILNAALRTPARAEMIFLDTFRVRILSGTDPNWFGNRPRFYGLKWFRSCNLYCSARFLPASHKSGIFATEIDTCNHNFLLQLIQFLTQDVSSLSNSPRKIVVAEGMRIWRVLGLNVTVLSLALKQRWRKTRFLLGRH